MINLIAAEAVYDGVSEALMMRVHKITQEEAEILAEKVQDYLAKEIEQIAKARGGKDIQIHAVVRHGETLQ